MSRNQHQLLPGSIRTFTAAGAPQLSALTHTSPRGNSPLIFDSRVGHTPPYFYHAIARPRLFADVEREFYEPVDMPGWRKHDFVQTQQRIGRNPYGSFASLASSLYDLDARGHQRELLTVDETIVGLILVCLGLSRCHVPLAPLEIEGSAKDTRVDVSSIRLGHFRWIVQLVFFPDTDIRKSYPQRIGHWTVLVWDDEAHEVYYFDALASGREERRNQAAEAWKVVMERSNIPNTLKFVQVPQVAQGHFECGYIAISNVYNLLRGTQNLRPVEHSNPLNTSALGVRSWGDGDVNAGGLTEEEYKAQVTDMINKIRGDIYSFFGYPVNCPLNPWYPLSTKMGPECMNEGVARGRWWVWGDAKPPGFVVVRAFNECRALHENRVTDLGRNMRYRTIEGDQLDWGETEVRRFWLADSAEAGAQWAYEPSGRPTYRHNPYRPSPAASFKPPFPPLCDAQGWKKPPMAVVTQAIRTASLSPAPSPLLSESSAPDTRPDPSLPREPPPRTQQPSPGPQDTGQRTSPERDESMALVRYNPLQGKRDARAASLLTVPSDASYYSGPRRPSSPAENPFRDSPPQPETPRITRAKEALEELSLEKTPVPGPHYKRVARARPQQQLEGPVRRSGRLAIKSQQEAQPQKRQQQQRSQEPVRRSGRSAAQPQPQPQRQPQQPQQRPEGPMRRSGRLAAQPTQEDFRMRLHIPDWIEDYRLREMTDNHGRPQRAPMSNCYGETPWNAVLWYARERARRMQGQGRGQGLGQGQGRGRGRGR